MRTLAAFRRARALAAFGVAGLVLSISPAASADSTGDAQAKAKAILAQVQKLQDKAKRAEVVYERSLAGVAASVNASVEADGASQQVAREAAVASSVYDDRVRSLYMSGGPLALYATLLTSGSVTDFQNRAVMVGDLVSVDRSLISANDAVVAQAAQQSRQADRRASRSIRTERSVAGVATEVLRLLAQQQQLLDEANAHVAHLKALDAARAALAAQNAAFATITAAQIATMQVLPPSPLYLSLYHRAAATCPGLSWTVLAAIGQVESGHGSNPSMSSAGALGPMQFLPSTFARYGVDGNHDGRIDIMDPFDAIYSAAAYLCANGGGGDAASLYNAIWHYNHADWYVQMVLTLARKYAA